MKPKTFLIFKDFVPKLGEQEVSSEQDEDDQEIIPFEFLQKTDRSVSLLF